MIENSRHQDVIVKGDTLDEVAAADMISLEKGPFYGFPMNVPQTATFSGLLANADCQLLDSDGEPIQNLYGCGETIYGQAGVAGALFTGAIAGTEAAESILGK